MKTVKEVLEGKTVHSYYKNESTAVNSNNTDNSITVASKIKGILDQAGIKPEGVAKMLCEGLDDPKSERYYTILATENPSERLLEAMHLTKDASVRGIIKVSKAVYFQGILKKWGLKTKFKI